MNKLISKILKEAEDSSDDFFQSKHVNKRRDNYIKKERTMKRENLKKLESGLKDIKTDYENKIGKMKYKNRF